MREALFTKIDTVERDTLFEFENYPRFGLLIGKNGKCVLESWPTKELRHQDERHSAIGFDEGSYTVLDGEYQLVKNVAHLGPARINKSNIICKVNVSNCLLLGIRRPLLIQGENISFLEISIDTRAQTLSITSGPLFIPLLLDWDQVSDALKLKFDAKRVWRQNVKRFIQDKEKVIDRLIELRVYENPHRWCQSGEKAMFEDKTIPDAELPNRFLLTVKQFERKIKEGVSIVMNQSAFLFSLYKAFGFASKTDVLSDLRIGKEYGVNITYPVIRSVKGDRHVVCCKPNGLISLFKKNGKSNEEMRQIVKSRLAPSVIIQEANEIYLIGSNGSVHLQNGHCFFFGRYAAIDEKEKLFFEGDFQKINAEKQKSFVVVFKKNTESSVTKRDTPTGYFLSFQF